MKFFFYIKFERKAIENHKKLIVFRFSVRYPVFFGDFFGENCRQKYRRNSFFEAFIEKNTHKINGRDTQQYNHFLILFYLQKSFSH